MGEVEASMGGSADGGSDDTRWVDALDLSELPVGALRAVKLDSFEVALVRLGEDEVCAVDNRCPHQGFPLAKGRLDGHTLTCAQHNFRYDLKSGKCVRGDEDVTVFPVRIEGGKVQLACPDRQPDAELEKRTKSLKEALNNGRLTQAARDIARLLSAGVEPARIALEMAAFDALHNEQGAGHALPVAADIVRIVPRYLGTDAALPLLHVADVAMDASKFRTARRVPASQDPGREPEGVAQRLITLIENDDAEAADGLVRGALWRKWTREQIEPWFHEINTAHFLGAGHGLIYSVKAFELLEAVGFEHARRILPGLTYALASMPREDTLPEWQWFRQRFAQLEPRLSQLWMRANQRALADEERRNLTHTILDGSREEAWHAVIGAWAAGVHVESVIDALSCAAAERLWRFDTGIDRDVTLTDGWLDVSHPFTYSNALRSVAARYRKPGLLKMVLFGVHFVNRHKPLDMPADRWTAIDAKGRVSFIDRDRFLTDLADMIRERAPAEAQRAALAYLNLGGSIDALFATLYDVVLKSRFARPIFTAHGIKLSVAACEEARALPEGARSWPIRALVRMLASPVSEQSLEGIACQARRLVEEGLVPKSKV
jgi:nitrite reductase/ring-hydroxylating ferredoxin subunit